MVNKVFDGRIIKCKSCEKELPCTAEYFYKSPGYKCKECCKLARKKNDAKNKEEKGDFKPAGTKCNICKRIAGEIGSAEVRYSKGGTKIIQEEIKICINRGECNFCRRNESINSYDKSRKNEKEKFNDMKIKCSKCEKELPYNKDNFYDTRSKICKECSKVANRENTEKNKVEKSKFKPPGVTCFRCNRVSGDIVTYEFPCASGGVRVKTEEVKIRLNRGECKICEKEDGRKFGKTDVRKEQKRQARQTLKEKDPHYQAKWEAKQRENPNCFRVISTNIRQETLRAKVDSKNYNQTLCTTVNDFRNKIASRFTETMNWGNHNEVWTFDHVIPLKLCNIDDVNSPHFSANLKNAGGWWNVAPIALTKNMEKKTAVDTQQLKAHLDWLEQYKEHPDVKNYVEFAKGFHRP